MKRAVLLLMLAGGCGFTQKHPGITVGIVSGTIGFGACGLSVERVGTCSAVGAVTGLVLGGITGLVTMFADTSAHELPPLEEDEPFVRRRVKTKTAPPPEPIDGRAPGDTGVPAGETDAPAGTTSVPAGDAGVPVGAPAGDADAPPSDAP